MTMMPVDDCCRGSYMKMLDKLAKLDDMTQLKDPKSPFRQDEDREYILRFFAFYNNLKNFKPSLHRFLNAEIRPKQHLSTAEVHCYEARFRKTLNLVKHSAYGQQTKLSLVAHRSKSASAYDLCSCVHAVSCRQWAYLV